MLNTFFELAESGKLYLKCHTDVEYCILYYNITDKINVQLNKELNCYSVEYINIEYRSTQNL